MSMSYIKLECPNCEHVLITGGCVRIGHGIACEYKPKAGGPITSKPSWAGDVSEPLDDVPTQDEVYRAVTRLQAQATANAMLASAFEKQEGGSHYLKMKIQPVEYIHKNGIGFVEGAVVKYVSRWRAKGGVADLKKARHMLDLLIEMEEEAKPSP
jgi:hypothetical protein